MINGGTSKLNIYLQEKYTLYYQAVEIQNNIFQKITEINNNGDKVLNSLDTEIDSLKSICDTAQDKYISLINNASEEEINEAKKAYETANDNYKNKVYEYNDKVKEIKNDTNSLIPTYVENNWIKLAEDNTFTLKTDYFTGEKAFAIWAKLVESDGTISYDESVYVVPGTKIEIAVESISLNKTSLEMSEESNYTLVPTITPSDATNKSILWSSDNENVAKVKDGKITAISVGTATITAKHADSDLFATCKVTVNKKATNSTINNQTTNSSANNQTTNSTANNKTTNSTVANIKLPYAGSLSYFIIFTLLMVSIIGFISYIKIKQLNLK